MSAKHTPTPWQIRQTRGHNPRHIERAGAPEGMGKAIAACSEEHDAAFIVRACNSHDDLVDLVKKLTARLAVGVEEHFTSYVGDEKLVAEGRKALAKARGDA
jgi:hypothetical protein